MSTFSGPTGTGPDGESKRYSPDTPERADQHFNGGMDPSDGHSPTAESTALAAHMRRISHLIDEVASAHTELASLVSDHLAPEITALRNDTGEQLAAHAAQIHQVLTATAARHSQPIDWPAMTADQATIAWENLAHWIADILVPWYYVNRDELPDC